MSVVFHSHSQSTPVEKPSSTSFSKLASKEGLKLAAPLTKALDAIHYPLIQRLLLGTDYHDYPIPVTFEVGQAMLDMTCDHSENINTDIETLVEFFMLGEPISQESLKSALPEMPADFIAKALELELFKLHKSGTISMNGVFLSSRQLPNKKHFYFFGDYPVGYPQFSGELRLQTETSSTMLSNFIASLDEQFTGRVMEIGCGSGIQLFTACKAHPGVTSAIGFDLDPRQTNLAKFATKMNGLTDVVTIFDDAQEFYSAYSSSSVALGIVPSLMPLPETIPFDFSSGSKACLRKYGAIDGQSSVLDLKKFYGPTAWGGAAGLEVTFPLARALFPYLEDGGSLVTVGEFGVCGKHFLFLRELRAEHPSLPMMYTFEEWEERTPREWAETTKAEIYERLPELKSKGNSLRVTNSILKDLAQNGIDSIKAAALQVKFSASGDFD